MIPKAILFDAYGTILSTGNGSVLAAKQILDKNRVKRLKSILQDRLYQSMICHEDKSYPKLIFSLQCFLLVNIFIVKQPTT